MKIFKMICLMAFGLNVFGQTPISLEDAIKEAIKNNLDIAIERNEYVLTGINNSWSNAGAYPTIQADLTPTISSSNLNQKLASGLDINRNGVVAKNFNAEVNANWNVLNGFKLYTTKKRLEQLEQIGELNLIQQINNLSYEVALTYAAAQQLIQQQKNIEEQISITQERIDINQKKVEVGASGKSDLLQAQIDKNSLISAREALAGQYTNTLISLGLLMGRSPGDYPAVKETMSLPVTEPLDAVIQLALKQNPTILATNKQIAVTALTQKETKAVRLPNVNVRTGYGYNRSQSTGGFSLFNQSYGPTASLGISVPIYSGGRVKSVLEQLDIQMKNQQLNYNLLILEYKTMITQAYNDVKMAEARILLVKDNIKLAKENLEISQGRAKYQSITALELRQAQYSLMELQTELINNTFLARAAKLKLTMLSGGSNWQ
ncbi:MAG TPA: TolC family protein [Saprospiraceae bacterium]|nr:TolC family protein [Saprospiraceae bacterium]MCC6688441.1 TolC family protein [Saprospiraceae bacterium]HMX82588.1 TolC family protein [Saprospiraceae bacterium]HMX85026.1 TolC family protein [Saprospiraceae bacterium]HMZ73942.1 TolC family protein [Saprospiraceae bacterium]